MAFDRAIIEREGGGRGDCKQRYLTEEGSK